jgi:hypothetical protein
MVWEFKLNSRDIIYLATDDVLCIVFINKERNVFFNAIAVPT